MIECDCFDADLHLARAGRRRSWHIGKFQLAIGDQSQRAHVNWLARPSGGLEPHHQRNVLAAKTE